MEKVNFVLVNVKEFGNQNIYQEKIVSYGKKLRLNVLFVVKNLMRFLQISKKVIVNIVHADVKVLVGEILIVIFGKTEQLLFMIK